MNELRIMVETTAMALALKSENSKREEIEEVLWSVVQKAMEVQQQICGGHK